MFDWLKNLGAKRRASAFTAHALRFIRAKFDAAQTTPDNRRHWANADQSATHRTFDNPRTKNDPRPRNSVRSALIVSHVEARSQ